MATKDEAQAIITASFDVNLPCEVEGLGTWSGGQENSFKASGDDSWSCVCVCMCVYGVCNSQV